MIQLPNRPIKIGVFLSGGLDSALLYYLVTCANKNQLHQIVPITVVKNNKTLELVKSILEYFDAPGEPVVLEGPVVNAVVQSYNQGFNRVYVGTIKEFPEFLIDWKSSTYPETRFFRTPLKHLDKSQIVKLILDHNLSDLFTMTHSCAVNEIGRCNACNRCRERKWGFDRLEIQDPGVL